MKVMKIRRVRKEEGRRKLQLGRRQSDKDDGR